MTAGARELIASGVCLVGIVSVLALIEPRMLDWLKLRLTEFVAAPVAVAQALVTFLGGILGATAERFSLWRPPVAILTVVAVVLVMLLRRL